jgi:hypothetical protein
MLGYLEEWWLGVFIAPTTKMAVGELCCRRAHRTVRCASHVTQPLVFERWSFRHVGHRIVRWCTDRSCSLSGVPSGACSDSARAVTLFTVHCRLLQTTVGAVSRCSAGTPDSPVNYSGEPFSETRSLAVGGNSPSCTGHCPVAHRTVRCTRPGQPSVFIAPFYLNPFLDFLLVCVEPLAPVELII